MSSTTNHQDDLDRPLWGAEFIGKAVDRNTRQTFYLLESGYLPATKVGSTWCSTKRRLLGRLNGGDGA